MDTIFTFIMAVIFLLISVFQFNEKGPILNNSYLFASEQERNTMNKKLYYRESGFLFVVFGVIFLLFGLEILLKTDWLYYVIGAVAIIAIVYAIVSTIKDVTRSNKK